MIHKILHSALFILVFSFGSFAQSETILVNENGDPLDPETKEPVEVVSEDSSEKYLTPGFPLVDDNGDVIFIEREDGSPSVIYAEPAENPLKPGMPLVDDNGDFIIIILDDGSPSLKFVRPVENSNE